VDHVEQANLGCDFDFLRKYDGEDELRGNARSWKRRAQDSLPSPF